MIDKNTVLLLKRPLIKPVWIDIILKVGAKFSLTATDVMELSFFVKVNYPFFKWNIACEQISYLF